MFAAPFGHGQPVGQPSEHGFHAAGIKELLHRQAGLLLPLLLERIGQRLAEFSCAEAIGADLGSAIATGDSAKATAGDIGAGESKSDQAKKDQGNGDADARLEERAEKAEHLCSSSLVWARQRTRRFG